MSARCGVASCTEFESTNQALGFIDEGIQDWSNAHANFLSSLLPAEKEDLLNLCYQDTVKARDVLFQAGDASDRVHIDASGCV
ncbi:MAG: hypothetical protein KTR35_04945 [Gammaproteobacteria bacterium]|nr:hypothetical protein [Gammaproteobacteria bacterium]